MATETAVDVVMPQMGDSDRRGDDHQVAGQGRRQGRARPAAVRDLDRQGRRRDPQPRRRHGPRDPVRRARRSRSQEACRDRRRARRCPRAERAAPPGRHPRRPLPRARRAWRWWLRDRRAAALRARRRAAPEPRHLLARLVEPALELVAALAVTFLQGRARLLQLAAHRLEVGLYLLERPAGVRELGVQPATRLSSSAMRWVAAEASARAPASSAAARSRSSASAAAVAPGVAERPPRRHPPRSGGGDASPSGLERDDGAGRLVLAGLGVTGDSGRDPVRRRCDGSAGGGRGAATRGPTISSASRKPLNSRLWSIWTGTSVRSTWTSEPSLRRAAASRCPPEAGSSRGSTSVSSSPRPTIALAGQPNTASAGRLQRVMQPLRSVSTKRASTSWRSSSSTASGGATASTVAFWDTDAESDERGASARPPVRAV